MPVSNASKCKLIFGGTACAICLCLVLTIVFLSTFIPSFHYVEYDEYALKQHKYGDVELGHVYTQGRYVFSPIYKFVKLPSTFQSIDITSAIFSNLGLEFDIHIAVYYQLPKERLGEIYHKFSLKYEDRITNIIKTTVKDIAPNYDVNDYVINRESVESTFSQRVHEYLKSTVGVDIPVLYFRILDIRFPESVVTSSLTSAIELQNNQIEGYIQEVAVIDADTNNMVATINIQTDFTLRSATIEANQIVSNSQSEADGILTSARGLGIQSVLSLLNITTPAQQNEFIKLVSILDANQPKILSGDFNVLVQ